MTLAIVAAMPEELAALQARLDTDRTEQAAGRQIHRGRLAGVDVVLVLAGIGKVAAATTTAVLLDRFAVDTLLFTGVAGGLADGVRVGDVVVGDPFLQHDMDASPLFPRWEVPGTGRARFAADAGLADALASAAARVLAQPHPARDAFGLGQARVHRGLIISGDRFVSSRRRMPAAAHRPARCAGGGDGRGGGGPGLRRLRPAVRRASAPSRTGPTTRPMSTSAVSWPRWRPSTRATSCWPRWRPDRL